MNDMVENAIAKVNLSFDHCIKSVRIWSYSGPYFSAFGLNIQSECGSTWTRITPNTGTFRAVYASTQNDPQFLNEKMVINNPAI